MHVSILQLNKSSLIPCTLDNLSVLLIEVAIAMHYTILELADKLLAVSQEENAFSVHLAFAQLPKDRNDNDTFVHSPAVTDCSHIIPIERTVDLLLLEVVQSALAMIEVVLPESSEHLVIFLVFEHSESLSGLRRVPLSPVDVAILVLQSQVLNFLFLWVLRVVLIVASILRIVLLSFTVCIGVVLVKSLNGVCCAFKFLQKELVFKNNITTPFSKEGIFS
jgi:hypothetical protein